MSVLRLLRPDAVQWERLESASVQDINTDIAFDVWGQSMAAVRFSVRIRDVSTDQAFGLIKDCSQRPIWDQLCHAFEVKENLGKDADIVTLDYRAPLGLASGCNPTAVVAKVLNTCGLEHRFIFTLLRAWRKDDAGYVVALRSIKLEDAEQDGNAVLPSGWLIAPSGSDCIATYVMQIGYSSIDRIMSGGARVSGLSAYAAFSASQWVH